MVARQRTVLCEKEAQENNGYSRCVRNLAYKTKFRVLKCVYWVGKGTQGAAPERLVLDLHLWISFISLVLLGVALGHQPIRLQNLKPPLELQLPLHLVHQQQPPPLLEHRSNIRHSNPLERLHNKRKRSRQRRRKERDGDKHSRVCTGITFCETVGENCISIC